MTANRSSLAQMARARARANTDERTVHKTRRERGVGRDIYIHIYIKYKEKKENRGRRGEREKGRKEKEKELRQRGDKTNQFSAFYDHSPRSHRVISCLLDRYRAVLRKGSPPPPSHPFRETICYSGPHEWRNVKISP